jgi:SAM-dependent methyltransferase
MINLSEIIVCPATHRTLSLSELDNENVLIEPVSGNTYKIVDGVFSMIPATLPAGLEGKKHMWDELQSNGFISYTLAPELNLTSGMEIVKDFSDFMNLSDFILDIGCGPQKERPQYATTKLSSDYVGLDPLLGHQPREFPFIHGIGEALPFPRDTFDNVIFCSSLDHMLNFKLSLEEAVRILKPGGKINLLLDNLDTSKCKKTPGGKALNILRRGGSQMLKGLKEHKLGQTLRYAIKIATLKIPSGAIDYFHPSFPDPQEVIGILDLLGCKKLKSRVFGSQIAIQSVKVA